MIETYLRGPYQYYFVDPLASFLVRKSTRPVLITFGALLAGIAATPFIAWEYAYAATFLILLSGYFDTLDGTIARTSGQTSPQGAVLDIVSDRIVEFAIVLGLFLADPLSRGLACILMLGSILLCITSFLVVGIFSENKGEKSFHYSPGFMERAEAFTFFILMILFPTSFFILAALFTTLVTLTAIVRISQFLQQAKI
jgi:archaetidylinositol phosphate synthase